MSRELGQCLGRYVSDAVPMWVEWAMHIPFLHRKLAPRAVSEIQVYEQGICLMQRAGREPQGKVVTLAYREIRRVWLEHFQTGNEQSGHTAFRIDVIAENLDTLFTLTRVDCAADDPVLVLMQTLYDTWRRETWRHYHVVAAVVQLTAAQAGRTDLTDPATPVYLCMQKPRTRYDYTSYHWEFPGGKVEEGETEPEALSRELREEMDYQVTIGPHLTTVEHRYRDFGISLSCYLCSAQTAEFVRREHQDHRWLTAQELQTLDWCAADAPVLTLLFDLPTCQKDNKQA